MSLGQGANLCTAIFQVVLDGQIPSIAEEVGLHSTPLEWRDRHLNFGNGTLTKMSHVNKRLGPGFFPFIGMAEAMGGAHEGSKIVQMQCSISLYLCTMTTSNCFFRAQKCAQLCTQLTPIAY